MKQRVVDFLDGEGKGVITSAELSRLGLGPAVLQSLLREKRIVRVARGTYACAARLDPGRDEVAARGRAAIAEHSHLLRLDALLRSYGQRMGASHQSTVLAYRLPVLMAHLDRIHIAHTRQGRILRPQGWAHRRGWRAQRRADEPGGTAYLA